MKACLIGLVLIVVSNAYAGEYSQYMSKKSFCDGLGEWAVTFYTMKAKGEKKFTGNHPTEDKNFDLLDQYMIDHVWDVADSEKHAFEGVWAKCMDNFDALILAKKAGKSPYEKLPY